MTSRLQIRRDTRSTWTTVNPVLLAGEIAFETDTDLIKIGDGVSTYSQLSYAPPFFSGTSSSLSSSNPVLGVGVPCVETDTGLLKVGDGSSAYNSLRYANRFSSGTASALSAQNPVLAAGEPAFETDTGFFKIGTGLTAYNSLSYPRLPFRSDTQANLTSANATIPSGQPVFETDTKLMKVGAAASYNSTSYNDGDYYRLLANGPAQGPGLSLPFYIASPTTYGYYSLAASGVYEFEYNLTFTRSATTTSTFYLIFSSSPAIVQANYIGSPSGGVGTSGTPQFGGYYGAGSTTVTLPATGSMTASVSHSYIVKGLVIANAATTMALAMSNTTGTFTPYAGSYIRIKRIPNVNYAMFT